MVSRIYKEGIKYKKCGVVLTCLEPKSGHTYDLLTDFKQIEKKECLCRLWMVSIVSLERKRLVLVPALSLIETGA